MEERKGLVFDIEEFAVFDGPGIRTTVFMKGCPLRCRWCHNPEGLSLYPQRAVSDQCIHCGQCKKICPTPDHCLACGKCLSVCPKNCIRIAGTYWTVDELVKKLSVNAEILKMNGGGITFSGGECSMQAPFIIAVRKRLPDLHFAIETCGYAPEKVFQELIDSMDLVMFDIKHTDSEMHKKYTGVGNELIHKNLEQLMKSNIPFYIRIPVIPGVNDTEENFEQIALWIKDAKNLQALELLPYNRSAGAKYKSVGMTYDPGFDTTGDPRMLTDCFEKYGIPVKIM